MPGKRVERLVTALPQVSSIQLCGQKDPPECQMRADGGT